MTIDELRYYLEERGRMSESYGGGTLYEYHEIQGRRQVIVRCTFCLKELNSDKENLYLREGTAQYYCLDCAYEYAPTGNYKCVYKGMLERNGSYARQTHKRGKG